MNSLENFTPYIEKAMKSWHCPGTAEEITPYKLDEVVVGFKTKRTRFDFVREDGLISKVMLKTPGATFEAPRR